MFHICSPGQHVLSIFLGTLQHGGNLEGGGEA